MAQCTDEKLLKDQQSNETSSQTWISALYNAVTTSNKNQTTSNEDTENKNEDNDIMSWFDDIISGCESDKSKKSILYETWSELSNNNIFTRLANSNFRKAATTFGKLCHRINLSYPPKEQLKPIENDELMKEIKYCVRHALASYKKIKLAFRTKENVIATKSTKTLLRDYFDIPKQDIIIDNSNRNLKQFRNKLHSPRFYLAIDHNHKKIMLSIRGTATTADRITDINGKAKPFTSFGIDGYAHEGILASTKYIFTNVTVELVKQCNKYTDYQAIITGHSLGGGVSALLGLMYYDHPVICKQNNLKCFCFASPPVLSKEFTDKNIGIDYILSITLSTDFITRLSLESVKHYNIRNDLIIDGEQELIDECMSVLDDEKENIENKRIKFLTMLKTIDTPNPEQQLYPLGRILWFVPNAVMDDDVVKRRKCLMCLNDEIKDTDEKNEDDNEEKDDTDEVNELVDNNSNNKRRLSLTDAWNKLSNKMSNRESRRTKKINKYGADKYVLCDATDRRDIFQELVLEFPESFFSHMPGRYLWACGTSITEPDV
eukprot:230990_1